MSHFAAEVIELPELESHPNADSLSLFRLEKPYKVTVVGRTEDWKGIKKAVYIPIDSICPNTPEFDFLGERKRVKAIKLRGVLSMGMLFPAKDEWEIGRDVTQELGIVKYDDTIDNSDKNKDLQVSRAPRGEVKYTDIESLRKYSGKLKIGEEVVISEKIHGANARYVFQDNQLFAGSHRQWLKEGNNHWWNAAFSFKAGLPEILPKYPDMIFFGEVYGYVQDLHYGFLKGGIGIRFFDIYDIPNSRYLDYSEFKGIMDKESLQMVPILFHGPWSGFEKSAHWAEGQTLAGASHGKMIKPDSSLVREGFVVKPAKERFDEQIGRVILKLHGEGYISRKGG